MANPKEDPRRPQSDRTNPVPHDKRHPPDGNPGDDQIEHLPGNGDRKSDQSGGKNNDTRQSRPRYHDGIDEYGTRFA